MSQDAPFNKYVSRDYPDCLVGCAALAAAQAMAHCKDSLTYKEQTEEGETKDKIYNLKMIKNALADSASNANIYNDDILYIVGKGGAGGTGDGHAWVIDGCDFCRTEYLPPHKDVQDVFFHCNWGWGGNCNGYYSGFIFITDVDVYSTDFMDYISIAKNIFMKNLFN